MSKSDEVKIRVFVSYARDDQTVIKNIADELMINGQIAVDYDQSEFDKDSIDYAISAEDDWWKRIEELIFLSDVFVFALSESSAKSNACNEEFAFARAIGKRIIPIIIGSVDFKKIPPKLATINAKIEFSKERKSSFRDQISELERALKIDVHWHRKHSSLMRKANSYKLSHDKSVLLRLTQLKEAEQWLSQKPANNTRVHQEIFNYIQDSRREEDRLNAIRKALFTTIFLAIGSIIAGSYLWLLDARSDARNLSSSIAAISPADNGIPVDTAVRAAIIATKEDFFNPTTPEAAIRLAMISQRAPIIEKVHSSLLEIQDTKFDKKSQSLLIVTSDANRESDGPSKSTFTLINSDFKKTLEWFKITANPLSQIEIFGNRVCAIDTERNLYFWGAINGEEITLDIPVFEHHDSAPKLSENCDALFHRTENLYNVMFFDTGKTHTLKDSYYLEAEYLYAYSKDTAKELIQSIHNKFEFELTHPAEKEQSRHTINLTKLLAEQDPKVIWPAALAETSIEQVNFTNNSEHLLFWLSSGYLLIYDIDRRSIVKIVDGATKLSTRYMIGKCQMVGPISYYNRAFEYYLDKKLTVLTLNKKFECNEGGGAWVSYTGEYIAGDIWDIENKNAVPDGQFGIQDPRNRHSYSATKRYTFSRPPVDIHPEMRSAVWHKEGNVYLEKIPEETDIKKISSHLNRATSIIPLSDGSGYLTSSYGQLTILGISGEIVRIIKNEKFGHINFLVPFNGKYLSINSEKVTVLDNNFQIETSIDLGSIKEQTSPWMNSVHGDCLSQGTTSVTPVKLAFSSERKLRLLVLCSDSFVELNIDFTTNAATWKPIDNEKSEELDYYTLFDLRPVSGRLIGHYWEHGQYNLIEQKTGIKMKTLDIPFTPITSYAEAEDKSEIVIGAIHGDYNSKGFISFKIPYLRYVSSPETLVDRVCKERLGGPDDRIVKREDVAYYPSLRDFIGEDVCEDRNQLHE